MHIRSSMIVLALAASLAGCGAAAQRPASAAQASARCAELEPGRSAADLYAPTKVSKVEPIYRTQFVARAINVRYVAGAELHVPAEPGMHQAYMERVLACHAGRTASAEHPNDPFAAEGIKSIDVTAQGPSMRIAITGADRSAGKAIWQRAEALYQPHGSVTVQQLAAANGTGGKL